MRVRLCPAGSIGFSTATSTASQHVLHPLTMLHPITMLLYHPLARWAATSAPSSAGASSSRSASPSSYASSTPDVAEGCKKGGWDTRRGAAGDGKEERGGESRGSGEVGVTEHLQTGEGFWSGVEKSR